MVIKNKQAPFVTCLTADTASGHTIQYKHNSFNGRCQLRVDGQLVVRAEVFTLLDWGKCIEFKVPSKGLKGGVTELSIRNKPEPSPAAGEFSSTTGDCTMICIVTKPVNIIKSLKAMIGSAAAFEHTITENGKELALHSSRLSLGEGRSVFGTSLGSSNNSRSRKVPTNHASTAAVAV